MTAGELIEELEQVVEDYGTSDIEIAVDITPPAEPNSIKARGREFISSEGKSVATLEIGWRIA